MDKKVTVIGGGLAGISTAIRLASSGFKVHIFEKNREIGGKMGELWLNDFRFDTGPSVLTMPFIIDELFDYAGYRRENLLEFVPIDPVCRYFWEDGVSFDAYSDTKKMKLELEGIFPSDRENYFSVLSEARKIYELVAEIFLFQAIHEHSNWLTTETLLKLLKAYQIRPFQSLYNRLQSKFNNPKLVQLFSRYATYSGSNPFKAPATLNIISFVELGLGVFYIRGGLFRLVERLKEIALELGVEIHTNSKVEQILVQEEKAIGVIIDGVSVRSDYVVSNADAIETHKNLLKNSSILSRLDRLEPSLSGMVFLWGVKGNYPKLRHHNILFSSDYRNEFKQLFDNRTAPDDPTIYISITGKTDPSHAPANHENWFVLLNMPYLTEDQDWNSEKDRMKSAVFRKLEKVGIDISNNIIDENIRTPEDFQSLYAGNRGSIYGISSNKKSSAFLRPANRSRQIQNLYFAGGSVHPGGGIPMVLLSGRITAELIQKSEGINTIVRRNRNFKLFHPDTHNLRKLKDQPS